MQFRQGTTVPVADRQLPGPAAMLTGHNMAAEQALIAEARARARRRRLKTALALTAATAVLSAGVLITLTVPGTQHKADALATAGPAVRTGTVTGHLDACYGMMLAGHSPPVTPGTVTAVRGTVTWKRTGPGTWKEILPNGPVVARAYISNNYHQVFRFALPPGRYVLIGWYDGTRYPPAGEAATTTQVSVITGKTLHADLLNDCK